MSFARTETQILLSDMANRLLGELNGFEARLQRLGSSTERMALWLPLAEQGILGVALPEEAGGFGGTARDLAVVMQAVGRHLVVEPVLANAVASGLLHRAGEDISAALSGQTVFAFAHDEGLDPFAPRHTSACRDGDCWRITGVKSVVRHADLAHELIVTASDGDNLAIFQVAATDRGVRSDPLRLMDASSAASVTFDNALAARITALPGAIDKVLALLAIGLATESIAIAEVLCEKTFAYLATRKQFGVPLAQFQALQHRAADMVSAAAAARALTDHAITALDTAVTGSGVALASAAKALADDAGRLIGHEAVQMHGGMGVSDELDVAHYVRRLAVIRASHGQAAQHRARFAAIGQIDGFADETPEIGAFRQEVRSFVRTHLPADLAARGRAGLEFGKEDFVRWQKILFAHGWFAAAWPREHGGGGWSLERQLALVQETGCAGAPMVIPYGVNMVGPIIYTFGTPEQRERHLPGILSSEVWWCQGYSEPNAGSDLASLKTTAVRDGDHYIVNGTKMWTTQAQWADWMHCLVRTDRDAKPQAGISFLLIDMKTPGITIRPIVTIDGQCHTNQVFLDDVRIPIANLVGAEGQGWTLAKFLLANERVAIADTGPKLKLLHDIKAMFRALVQREGVTPGVTGLADRLADAEIQLAALCALERDYVRAWQDGASRAGPEASILKVRGTEILQLLSEIALAIAGPWGAVHDPADLHLGTATALPSAQRASAMAHQYLYGRCWSIFGGTNEVQRGLIARSVLG